VARKQQQAALKEAVMVMSATKQSVVTMTAKETINWWQQTTYSNWQATKTAAATGKSGNKATTSGSDRSYVRNKAVSGVSNCKSQKNNT